jgi:hypothetical protein
MRLMQMDDGIGGAKSGTTGAINKMLPSAPLSWCFEDRGRDASRFVPKCISDVPRCVWGFEIPKRVSTYRNVFRDEMHFGCNIDTPTREDPRSITDTLRISKQDASLDNRRTVPSNDDWNAFINFHWDHFSPTYNILFDINQVSYLIETASIINNNICRYEFHPLFHYFFQIKESSTHSNWVNQPLLSTQSKTSQKWF